MKKRVLMAVGMLALVSFLLTGCSTISKIDVAIDKHGKASVTSAMLLDKEMYETVSGASAILDIALAFLPDSVRSLANKYIDLYYDELTPVTFENAKYWQAYETVSYSSTEDLKDDLLSGILWSGVGARTVGYNALFTNLEISDTEFAGTIDPSAYNDNLELLSSYVTTRKIFAVTFASDIEEANGAVGNNNHTVSWEIFDYPVDVYVKTAAPSFPWLIVVFAVLAGAGVIVAIVLIVNSKKRKGGPGMPTGTMNWDNGYGMPTSGGWNDGSGASSVGSWNNGPGASSSGGGYCTNCGNYLGPGTSFCPRCGKPQ